MRRIGFVGPEKVDDVVDSGLSFLPTGKSITNCPEQTDKDQAEDKPIEREQHEDERNLAASQLSLPGK